MANPDRARKLLVRTALVTSTTIATLVGAQNLAMLDAQQFLPTETASTQTNPDVAVLAPVVTTTTIIAPTATDATILHAAPSITILRQSGQQTTTANVVVPTAIPMVQSAQTTVIQPPVAQIVAPQAVTIQQVVPVKSRSSR